MRVTNNMIMTQAGNNINSVKILVDKENNQMTSQKRIERPSEDPVIAVRSLRLGTSLSKIDQYYDKNIPDAEHWIDVTEEALKNMKKSWTDIHTLAVQGANNTLTSDDRQSIYQQLKALQEQIYSDGNADYAGRTLFTGYRTDKKLTFADDAEKSNYDITQKISVKDEAETVRYESGSAEVPTEEQIRNGEAPTSNITENRYNRVRLAYDNITTVAGDGTADAGNYSLSIAAADGTDLTASYPVTVYADEDAWAAANNGVKTVDDNGIVLVKSTGDLVLGNTAADALKSQNASITISYNKNSFDENDLRPEYYYNCVDKTDPANPVRFTRYDDNGNFISQDIKYTVSGNQELEVNTEAKDVFDSSMQQDLKDMLSAVDKANEAHEKADKIDSMIQSGEYTTEQVATLKTWKEQADKEAAYADSNLQSIFNTNIGNSTSYMEKTSLANTELGCRSQRLTMTEKRVSQQQESLEDLQSENDDMDLSEIIMKYTAAYTAYQSSLTAASRIGQLSLLNYL